MQGEKVVPRCLYIHMHTHVHTEATQKKKKNSPLNLFLIHGEENERERNCAAMLLVLVLKYHIDLSLQNKCEGLVGVNPHRMHCFLMILPAKVTSGAMNNALSRA